MRIKIVLWGREFNLDVSYDCYPGEEVLQEQKEALDDFVSKEEPTKGSLPKLKQYILDNSEEIENEVEIKNIFKYIMPKALYIPRQGEKTVAVLCDYRFDMEHGLAVVFEKGEVKEIGSEDIIL